MKRVLLFIATNIAVVMVLGVIINIVLPLFGVSLQNTSGLLVFAAIFGFGGAFISLAISKWLAKRSTGARVIVQPSNDTEHWLLTTVAAQAKQAGIAMPEVAIFPSQDPNAFATGMRRNNALVAVSLGLLNTMSQTEAEAVLAHEISHIANGDMVTMTLIQGVVNTFVIFFARIVAGFISNALSGGRSSGSRGMGGIAYFATVLVLEMIFGILASIIVLWFSRRREYRADAGSAKLVGSRKMIAALKALKRQAEPDMTETMAAFAIYGKTKTSELFMSHPPLTKRIAALEQAAAVIS